MPTATRTVTRPPQPRPIIADEEQDEDTRREMFKFRTSNILGGRSFGAAGPSPRGDQAPTPPRQDSKSTQDPDKTPSARAKVLPWVNGVEDSTVPEGMFGPYESLPPTRMPTVYETQQRIPHPFAYSAQVGPYDDGGEEPRGGAGAVPPVPTKDAPVRRGPQDGIGPMAHGEVDALPTRGRPGGSPGGDTFGGREGRTGLSPRKAATQLTDSPKRPSPARSAPARRAPPPAEPLPPTPNKMTNVPRKPVPTAGTMQDTTAHAHAHAHAHPFSHAEAAQRQAEAMELAHAQALAQLENAHGDVEDFPRDGMGMPGMDPVKDYCAGATAAAGGMKGPRATYETGTSGPSFGHIFHANGHPVSAHQSYQPYPLPHGGSGDGAGAVGPHMSGAPAGPGGTGGGAFFRIPFGVPMGMPLPRPMMLMRTGTGAGLGIGIGSMAMGGLQDVPELDERRRDDRSAFVETVHDEESPVADAHTTHRSEMPARTTQTQSILEQAPARTESEVQPATKGRDRHTAATRSTVGGLPPAFDSQVYPPPSVKHHTKTKTATKAPTQASRAPRAESAEHLVEPSKAKSAARSARAPASAAGKSARSRKAPTHAERSSHRAPTALAPRSQAPHLGDAEVDPSIASDTRTGEARTERTFRVDADADVRVPAHVPAPAAPLVAPTSASNIKRLVKDSGVHDEVLCQLLDAAKLNLIGSEAKKALQRAARARVIELRDQRETQAQMQAALAGSMAPRSRDLVREEAVRAASATTVPPFSPPPESPGVGMPPLPSVHNQTASYRAPTVEQGVRPPATHRDPSMAQSVRPPTSHHAPTLAQSARMGDAASHREPTVRAPQSGVAPSHAPTKRTAPSAGGPGAGLMSPPTSVPMRTAGQTMDPYATPKWAKDIKEQMLHLDQRFDELQRQNDMLARQAEPDFDPVSGDLIHELVYHGGFPGGMPFDPYMHGHQGAHIQEESPRSARIQTMTPSNKPRVQSGEVTLTWGSEVELPSGGGGSPVKPGQGTAAAAASAAGRAPTQPARSRGGASVGGQTGFGPSMGMMPTINVQPPTESNARTRVASIPSRTDPRTPAARTVELEDPATAMATGMTGMTGMAEMDKSLPATPVPRQAPDSDGRAMGGVGGSPPSVEAGRGAAASSYAFGPGRGDGTKDSMTTDTVPNPHGHAGVSAFDMSRSQPATATVGQSGTAPDTLAGVHPSAYGRPTTDRSAMTADAVTAPTHISGYPVPGAAAASAMGASPGTAGGRTPTRDVVHLHEAASGTTETAVGLEPWDAVLGRLYQWALVWEEESFNKALEGVALGKQVESLSLTVFTMMVYKRLLAHNLTAMPPKACDKLFVPPLMADAINHAVHNKQFDSARQMLDELWYPWGFQHPPRVIIALAKHRNEPDKWTAHRFDLSSGHLTSYGVSSEQYNLPDGRPFMWWHAIRMAWPEYNIPDPNSLRQRVEHVVTPPADSADNSLKAMNYARNLLLGFRPELARDLSKLRETVWEEVKRLSNKKRAGHLVAR